jgi:hypothetical protein
MKNNPIFIWYYAIVNQVEYTHSRCQRHQSVKETLDVVHGHREQLGARNSRTAARGRIAAIGCERTNDPWREA